MELNELAAKVDKLDRRLTELEMKGASNLTAGIGALEAAVNCKLDQFQKRLDGLEAQIKSLRTMSGSG